MSETADPPEPPLLAVDIDCPDGTGMGTAVTINGQEVGCVTRITYVVDARDWARMTIECEGAAFHASGLASVVRTEQGEQS